MGHKIISGRTESGKTTLALHLVEQLKRRGNKVAVLDPNLEDWYADFITYDADEFLRYCKENQSHYIVVDETGDALDRYDKTYEWLATRSRHWGHRLIVVSQRGAQISTTIRTQCSELYLFECHPKDAKVWSMEFNDDAILEASKLPQYACIYKKGSMPSRKIKLKI